MPIGIAFTVPVHFDTLPPASISLAAGNIAQPNRPSGLWSFLSRCCQSRPDMQTGRTCHACDDPQPANRPMCSGRSHAHVASEEEEQNEKLWPSVAFRRPPSPPLLLSVLPNPEWHSAYELRLFSVQRTTPVQRSLLNAM